MAISQHNTLYFKLYNQAPSSFSTPSTKIVVIQHMLPLLFCVCRLFYGYGDNCDMQLLSDTYVKLSLMNSSGQEVQRCKTSIRRGQPNPLFKETFMLQVALFQLPEVTLMVSVYNKKSMKKKEMIGWFSLGRLQVSFEFLCSLLLLLFYL